MKNIESLEQIAIILQGYEKRSDFAKENQRLYQYLLAKHSEILDKKFPKLRKKECFKWTLQNALEEAKKYSSRGTFRLQRKGAYQFLTKFYPKELIEIFPKDITVEEALKIAQQFTDRTEFRIKETKAFNMIFENCPQKLEELLPLKKPRWTLERAIEEAKIYKTRTQLYLNSRAAYYYLVKNAPDKLPKPQSKGAPLKWTVEKATEEAKKHKTRTDFYLKANRAFYLLYNDYPDVLDSLFPLKTIMTLDKAIRMAVRFTDLNLFSKTHTVAFSLLKEKNPELLVRLFPSAHIQLN